MLDLIMGGLIVLSIGILLEILMATIGHLLETDLGPDQDYGDYLVDADDSIALLVDLDQALEMVRLSNMAVAELAPEDAPEKEPLVAIVEALEQEVLD